MEVLYLWLVVYITDDLHALTEDENLLHICSDLGLSQFLAYICHNHSDASDALKATWKGRTPLDVARYRACMPADSGCHDGHIEARSLLEPMQEQMLYGAYILILFFVFCVTAHLSDLDKIIGTPGIFVCSLTLALNFSLAKPNVFQISFFMDCAIVSM